MRWRHCFAITILLMLAACAALPGHDPVRVQLAGIEALPGQGLELRMLVKLRVQNPNDMAIDFDGLSVDVEVQGRDFASGVSDQRGRLPRFGETVVAIPVTISALALIKQALQFSQGGRDTLALVARGKLSTPPFGSVRFETRGEFDLPAGLVGAPSKN